MLLLCIQHDKLKKSSRNSRSKSLVTDGIIIENVLNVINVIIINI